MGSPLRFLDGVSNRQSDHPMGAFPYLDPTKWAVFMEDFTGAGWKDASISVTARDATLVPGYQILVTGSANITLATDATNELGCLKLNTVSDDNSTMEITSTAPGWTMQVGKKFIMQTYLERTVTTIAQNEMFVGLASSQTATTFMATNGLSRTFDDGIGWISYDTTGASIHGICGENDVFSTTVVKTTAVTATWYKLSVYYDGAALHWYVDDQKVKTNTPTAVPISVVGPTFYFKAGADELAQTLLIDYLFVARER